MKEDKIMNAEEIKELRLKLLFTQAEFAKELGVSTQTVKVWERGKQKPRLRHLRRLRDLAEQKPRHW